jgi:hypothetical protein
MFKSMQNNQNLELDFELRSELGLAPSLTRLLADNTSDI